ncbi:trans-aconitate 2-methyltransferase [Ruegeria denitrificans]|uniref:Trans-aconitate 2-methyltransferase n=1 Tax=Ruegeria denitrificans TaxID=1715692 RepID=A0A0P1IGF2_9RHOB|nr:methyltransferase domain-containing protein [Ruegeria denitrificans]CUJ98973.1 trans-aconitate 2-methyltransferase [Ruegeria denitrificans]
MNTQMTSRVQRSFSRSFRSYHGSACQQARIAEQLAQDLQRGGAPTRFASALEFGCGTGHLTQRLCTRFAFDGLTVNDLSPEAYETATTFGAGFLCGDAETVGWPEKPDLIASASMIQWLPDPAVFLRRAARALAPGGWLAVSGFGSLQYQELVQVGTAAKAPGLCGPENLSDAVGDVLEVISVGETEQQMHFSSPRNVLNHLRRTGVNGRAQKQWTKSSLLAFSNDYVRQFGGESGVPLTYHPTWIIARKPG